MDGPCQCSTNVLVILESGLACTFTSDQQCIPTGEEDGVSVTVKQLMVVLHRGDLVCASPCSQPCPGGSGRAQVCVHKPPSLSGIHNQIC